jgi:hypothetical protein
MTSRLLFFAAPSLFLSLAACTSGSTPAESASSDVTQAPDAVVVADGKLFDYSSDPEDFTSKPAVVTKTGPIDLTADVADAVGVDLPPVGNSWGTFGIGLRATGSVEHYTDFYGRPRSRFTSLKELLVCPTPGSNIACSALPADDRHGPICAAANIDWLRACEGVTVDSAL